MTTVQHGGVHARLHCLDGLHRLPAPAAMQLPQPPHALGLLNPRLRRRRAPLRPFQKPLRRLRRMKKVTQLRSQLPPSALCRARALQLHAHHPLSQVRQITANLRSLLLPALRSLQHTQTWATTLRRQLRKRLGRLAALQLQASWQRQRRCPWRHPRCMSRLAKQRHQAKSSYCRRRATGVLCGRVAHVAPGGAAACACTVRHSRSCLLSRVQ